MKTLSRPEVASALLEGGWFSGLQPDLRETLIEAGQVLHLAEGKWLYGAEDVAEGLYAVVRGSVLLYRHLGRGDDVLFHVLGRGEWFGEISQTPGVSRLATAVIAEESDIFFIPARDMRSALAREPALWAALAELLRAHLATAIELLAGALSLPPAARVAGRLLALVESAGRADAVRTLHLTQDQLAEMVGLTRKTVHPILRDMERAGLLSRGYRTLTIIDIPALRRWHAAQSVK